MQRSATILATAGLVLGLTAAPVSAACHVAAFVETVAEGEEAVGVVSLVVELQGGVASCAGTVDVASEDGSATAGSDYEPVSTTLTFEEGDDRVETVDLVLLDDDEAEGVEDFQVVLSNPTGSISGTGDPATVTIVDDEQATTSAPSGEGSGDAAVDDAVAGPDDDGGVVPVVVVALVVLAAAVALGVRRRGRS